MAREPDPFCFSKTDAELAEACQEVKALPGKMQAGLAANKRDKHRINQEKEVDSRLFALIRCDFPSVSFSKNAYILS